MDWLNDPNRSVVEATRGSDKFDNKPGPIQCATLNFVLTIRGQAIGVPTARFGGNVRATENPTIYFTNDPCNEASPANVQPNRKFIFRWFGDYSTTVIFWL